MRRGTVVALLCVGAMILGSLLLVSCSSGTSSQTGFVNTSISDPAPCSTPAGVYSAVWVTVTDVQIHNSSTGQWTDLTKGMAPTQVNLLSSVKTECFLAMLGSTTELQAGSYEQIRITLADTNANLKLGTDNGCGKNGAPLNCVVVPAGTFPLLLSSEDKNGIKIPSGQIAGGAFVVAAGQTKDLDIDFSVCASIVVQGNGQYRLKPVLHAGEVGLNSAVNGKVVDASNNNLPVNGGITIVALEERDANGIDRVLLSTRTDANGGFALCPVPPGQTYDLVAVAIDKNRIEYATTVITGVQAGTVVGNVPVFPTVQSNAGPALIAGAVSTSGSSGEDVLLSALEGVNNGAFTVTVPPAELAAATQTVNAAPSASYSFSLPGVNPAVTAFGTPMVYTQNLGATYKVDAQTLPLQTQVCTSATEVQSNASYTINPGDMTQNVALSFSGCTPPPSQ